MIVSVSGFGWSGSGAVIDMLKEYSDIEVAFDGYNVDPEFILLAENDGIRDLEYHLIETPCRLQSSLSLKRFLRLVKSYNKFMKVNDVFDGKLIDITENYLEKLTDFKFVGATYHEYYQTKNVFLLYNKIICYMLGNRFLRPVLKNTYRHFIYEKEDLITVSYNPERFMEYTKTYLNTIFNYVHKNKNFPIVFDQMFPSDNPLPYMKYTDESRCVVVRRDPRDTYLLAKCAYNSKVAVPVNNVKDFVTFYRKIVEDTIIDNSSILNIQFEDLVYQYEKTKNSIENFLGIAQHTSPQTKFNPAISANNTQLFKKYKGFEEDIRFIEEALPESIYPFEQMPQMKTTAGDVF